ncbi:unnamed protein product [Urochloa humidicola]
MEQPGTRSRALPALMEELVEEILLRLPPEEPPAHLVRAAMVCKAWCCIVSDDGFHRRYCRFHRATPPTLLGYVCGVSPGPGPQFVPTTSYFSPPPLATRCGYRTMDCRHGRVLIKDISEESVGFIVCDLITGNRQHLSFPAGTHQRTDMCCFTGAVLCARHQHGGCAMRSVPRGLCGDRSRRQRGASCHAHVCESVLIRDWSMEPPNPLR